MNTKILIPLLAYLLIVAAISLFAVYQQKRATGTFLNEYFLGGRTLGGFLLAMTLTTAYISASSFVGGPGAAYKYGLGWIFLAMVQVPAVWLSLGVLGKKFAILARRYNAVTLNDILYAHFRSSLVVWLASITLLLAFIAVMTVQFIGGARLLETVAGVPYSQGLLTFGGVIALYTALGGFRASVLNDAMQGIVMLAGTFLLLFAVIHAAGGPAHAVATLKQINPQLIDPRGAGNIITGPLLVSFTVLVCFGVLGLPNTAIRSMSYRDSKAVHRGIFIGTLVMTLLMLGMHLAGALGRAVIPDLHIPDLVIPTLMIKVLPPFAAGIFLAAPMAAIMSNVNAHLLQASATLIKDLYLRVLPQRAGNERHLRRLSTLLTLGLGVLMILTAWRPPDMLIWMNLLAFGALETVFLWPLLLGLYWQSANATGAVSSMLCGAVSYTLLASFDIHWWNFHPIVPSLLLSLAAFLIGNRLGKPAPQAMMPGAKK
ncbi:MULTISPECIES: sodium/pantothenate symporter [Tatumella]|uniref:Sodium/pantothenate symporter n=1 Tax=Tatumella punctata TaxID=399969 RepID=A0ABW1VNC6_9GAMM|nr:MULTISPECIES: sodium/pantothenate symporter [unclassified Tatumella]MBS0877305.1 sodium/pantothenate symporter [Tatumella sp. JGM82]MBS0890822.1 sodium/pantothenate symporter [Tatumella sp. JGM94]MBS0901702.1 sodium/pantothenate symporter [Tatumella sp. JGM100]